MTFLRIAVIGAGPAGSRAATRLAGAGHEVHLLDRTFDREKPCGGGVPWAGLGALGAGFPAPVTKRLKRTATRNGRVGAGRPARDPGASRLDGGASPPGLTVKRLVFEGPDGERAELPLPCPLGIFSRRTLDGFLVEDARRAGARLTRASVLGLRRDRGGWDVALADGSSLFVDHLVGADGAKSVVRRLLATPFPSRDLTQAVGWYVPGPSAAAVTIRFDARIDGYLWIFPRTDHLAIGACAPLEAHATETLWTAARDLLPSADPSGSGIVPYSALIPTLRPDSLRANAVDGPGWSLVGDASGAVDPLTREGIRHALRSSDLLAEAFESGEPERYGSLWKRTFLEELLWASSRRKRFFSRGNTSRLVRYASRSGAIRGVLVDLVLGEQDYRSLHRRLLRAALPAVVQLGCDRARRLVTTPLSKLFS